MKCVCGYTYEEKWNKEKRIYEPVSGDEAFIQIHGTFLVESTGYYRSEHQVQLFSCPKCKTVQLYD